MKVTQSKLEYYFETAIWQLRWSVVIAVVFSALTALVMFYVAAVDAYYVIEMISGYAQEENMLDRKEMRGVAVGHVVEVIDGFLLAVVLLIFAYGTYELYVSRMDGPEKHEAAEHLLQIENLDDLKARLGKVVLMILIVKFFEISLTMEYTDVKELTIFALSIGLISLSFFMAELAARKTGQLKTRQSDQEKRIESLKLPPKD